MVIQGKSVQAVKLLPSSMKEKGSPRANAMSRRARSALHAAAIGCTHTGWWTGLDWTD